MINLESLFSVSVTFTTLHNDFYAAVRAYNSVISGDNKEEIEKACAACEKARDTFNDAVENHAYLSFVNSENPVKTCLECATIAHVRFSVKTVNDEQTVDAVTEQVMIDLPTLDKYMSKIHKKRCMASYAWKEKVEEARKVVSGHVLSGAYESTNVATFMKTFDKTFGFAVKGARDDCGEADFKRRYSVNKTTIALQDAVDTIIYNDATGGGKNEYRVLKRDAHVITHTIARKGAINTIKFPSASAFLKNFTDMLIRIVNNAEYEGDYTIKK